MTYTDTLTEVGGGYCSLCVWGDTVLCVEGDTVLCVTVCMCVCVGGGDTVLWCGGGYCSLCVCVGGGGLGETVTVRVLYTYCHSLSPTPTLLEYPCMSVVYCTRTATLSTHVQCCRGLSQYRLDINSNSDTRDVHLKSVHVRVSPLHTHTSYDNRVIE